MRQLQRVWPALEQLPGLTGTLATWREHLGEEMGAMAALLRPTDRRVARLPCPSPGGDGCPRRVVEHGDGTIIAVCGDRPQRCSPIELARTELIVHALDPRQLCRAITSLLDLEEAFQVFEPCRQTWRVGDYVPLSGERFPVYLAIPDSPDEVHAIAVRLSGLGDRSFLLALPRRAIVEPTTVELLARGRSRILGLDEIVAVNADGQWTTLRPAVELLREFRKAVLGERETTVPVVHFPTPAGARWEEVRIRFLTQHQVHVRVQDVADVYEHTQMGMANRRNDQPTKQWELLQLFAEHRGELSWSDFGADRKNEHRRLRLARQLREIFGIDGDPFDKLPAGRGWRTRFAVIRED